MTVSITTISETRVRDLRLSLASDGLRWYVRCHDMATGDTYQHVDARGTLRAGDSLFVQAFKEFTNNPNVHPANPDGSWWLIGWSPEEA